jgi:toluene monooxygenase system protein E
MSSPRTYWHLESLKRPPTDYEIASTRLLYHPERGFEVEVPVADWYVRHQKNSPFVLPDPDAFVDPRATTYTEYTRIQREQELEANQVLEEMEDRAYDAGLTPAWLGVLSRVLAPLRYPFHGLQMIAAYVGQMAPGGRIAIAALFQCGDEVRRIQRIAYRVRQLQETHPGFGLNSREIWEKDPLWQPFRKCVERLLVTYDWGEAFVALNAVLKPLVDELFMIHLSELAAASGDPLLPRLLGSLALDCRWHREWTRALLRTAVAGRPENRAVARGWIRRWHPEALQAIAPFGPVFDGGGPSVGPRFAAVMARLHAACRELWSDSDLSVSPE